jgi:hypothetical protein
MKILISVICLILGFSVGWIASSQVTQAAYEKKQAEAYPDDFREFFDAVSDELSSMSPEEIREILVGMKAHSANSIREIDYMNLWRGVASAQILIVARDRGEDQAFELARSRVRNFREAYERGLEVGDWKKIGDTIYHETSTWDLEPIDDGNAEKPPGVEREP